MYISYLLLLIGKKFDILVYTKLVMQIQYSSYEYFNLRHPVYILQFLETTDLIISGRASHTAAFTIISCNRSEDSTAMLKLINSNLNAEGRLRMHGGPPLQSITPKPCLMHSD